MPTNKKKQPVDEEVKEALKAPDTAPDEFIAPKADTDIPIDGQVRNDAVLRGEDHAQDRITDDEEEPETPKKMDAHKS
ncbi:hypothetical protein [Paraflavitalea pollutisoli]|uniref:hypothetical protein n=1 Tax=Paraflavitalea pollutisoli TaxID=3034143 RepID=UPI0023ED252B|nr:hypothetical protein [Paraflavitalea sp. H1-2-19X]